MTRKLVVYMLADTSSLKRGYQEAANGTKKFEAEMSKMGRTMVFGSSSMKGFAHSLVAGTAGFVGFATAAEAIHSSVQAAIDAGKAQRSLAAQMKAAGESFTANKKRVDEASLSLEKYGFTSEDSEKALTVLERGTGRISRAIQLQGVAANLARAKNIDLASAANVLAKVFGGQESALRRAVPGLEKTAHGMDLIREAAQKLQGQAAANTTIFDRFHATLQQRQPCRLQPVVSAQVSSHTVPYVTTRGSRLSIRHRMVTKLSPVRLKRCSDETQ